MKHNKSYSTLRVPSVYYQAMIDDLQRPHDFAMERVGFFSTNVSNAGDKFRIITVTEYHSVDDRHYINDPYVGAKINGAAIREAMQRIISSGMGCLHVHLHNHTGKPGPSYTDLSSLPEVAKAFHNADSKSPNGYAIFSKDSFYCIANISDEYKQFEVDQLTIVGYPMHFTLPTIKRVLFSKVIYDRQSFLGVNAQTLLSSVRVGIAGLGGGGSHVVQQLAHLGIINYSIFDSDHIESTNHNRLIGGWFVDIAKRLKKTIIARRLIKKINPKAKVEIFTGKWQEFPNELKKCDIVVGCVDSFDERAQLEGACRRALIPSIDIGMDVHKIEKIGNSISGQVILSMPGAPCMRCMHFITEEKLSAEAKKYGAAGGKPQVVWSNGVLASIAVGVIVDLITGWSKLKSKNFYLSYDGECGHLSDHARIDHCPKECQHYKLENTGEPIFKSL